MVKFITAKDFVGTRIEKSLVSENDLEKGGEGSRGGKVIGHTKSGKPVYAGKLGKEYKNFTNSDHHEAQLFHRDEANKLSKKLLKDLKSKDSSKILELKKKEVEALESHQINVEEPETSIPFRVGKVQDHHEAADTLEEFGHKIDRKNMIANKHGDTIFHDEKGRKAGVMTTNKVLSVHHYDDLTKGDYSELEVDKDLLLEPFVEKLEKSLEIGEINMGQFLKSVDELDSLKES